MIAVGHLARVVTAAELLHADGALLGHGDLAAGRLQRPDEHLQTLPGGGEGASGGACAGGGATALFRVVEVVLVAASRPRLLEVGDAVLLLAGDVEEAVVEAQPVRNHLGLAHGTLAQC